MAKRKRSGAPEGGAVTPPAPPAASAAPPASAMAIEPPTALPDAALPAASGPPSGLRVLFATSEIAPWIKTGGLADVAAALPAALHADGMDVRVLVPSYPALKAAFPDAPLVAALPAEAGMLHGAGLRLAHTAGGLPIYLLECDAFFDRPGNPYLGPDGRDWLDNSLRFGLLSHVAALLSGAGSPLDWRPQILHCNDWQTGLAPAYLRYRAFPGQARSVITVHNLAFQGLFGQDLLAPLGLPPYAWHIDGVEYHGWLSFLKAGLQHADAITTVSPTYAREIQTDAEGMGLGGLLRIRATELHGIINGIDVAEWNPAADRHLPAGYDADNLAGKAACRVALRREMGLDDTPGRPLLGIVSRLTHQKGLDLVPAIAAELAALPVQIVVLGSGAAELETAYRDMATRWPGQFAVRIGFDEGLSHRIEAGADLFLMPSRFEPCGLNQMYSQRYGTPPIVRATGGLADTVQDQTGKGLGTGFVFRDATPEALLATIHRAVGAWRDTESFAAIQRRAMKTDFSWREPARQYAEVYQHVLKAP